MIEGVDIDIDFFMKFIAGGGLPGWITGVALLLLSIRQKEFLLQVAKMVLSFESLKRSLDENTREMNERNRTLRDHKNFYTRGK